MHPGDAIFEDGCVTDVPGISAGHFTGAAAGYIVVLSGAHDFMLTAAQNG